MPSEIDVRRQQSAGVAYAGAAYLLWGFLPLYFLLLVPTGPWEVVAWRVVFSFVFCILLLTVVRGWARLIAILRQPRFLAWTALAGLLIYVNWQAFVIGTLTGHVVETSLGYFINPITTVLLGVFVLRERIRRLQWAAIGVAAFAVVVIIVGYGSVPWIALTLTASFGLYGLLKKKIGPTVDAVSGLTLESLWLLPIAGIQLFVVAQTTGLTLGTENGWHTLALVMAGVVTAVPLLLFASGTRRISLAVVGMIQFVTPIMQFLIGVLILQEPMPPERWIGFILVWVAVGVFVVDLLLTARRTRRTHTVPLP
ncbi:MAG: EamA family transporter RarD [Actinomycetota bacterium]